MDFPGLNAFFRPILSALGDEDVHTRPIVIERVSKAMGLTKAQLDLKTANDQFLINHRYYFAEGHLVKAGFVNRDQEKEIAVTTLMISPLGLQQLRRKSGDLTLGYIQTYYTGRVFRGSGSDETQSSAEIDLFEAFDQLSDAYSVFHSIRWNAHTTHAGTIGEADFVVVHPEYGVLVIEVKGGAIALERRNNRSVWTSTNRYGQKFTIKNPIGQAERNQRNLRAWLINDRRTQHHHYAVFPAIALPDVTITEDISPDLSKEIVIDMHRSQDIETTLEDIFRYWQRRADERNQKMGGMEAVRALRELLMPTRQLNTDLSVVFERERQKIDEITRRQYQILSLLRNYKRMAVGGGAGTGKTMIAMEKARQLALSGFRVAFLTFNRNIAHWIDRNLNDTNITVATFHSFTRRLMKAASIDYEGDDYYDTAADLLAQATAKLHEIEPSQLFDSLIVDEGQDFSDTWWLVVTEVLKAPDEGIFYVFFDDNQRLYEQMTNIPIDVEPIILEENCRNTQSIHVAMRPYTQDEISEYCVGPQGRPIHHIDATSPKEQDKALQRLYHQLVNENAADPYDIVVLTPARQERSHWTERKLGNFVITWDLETQAPMPVRVSTIYGYKGLEAAIVILTELDKRDTSITDQLMYVGLSRARHDVYIIGDFPEPNAD